MSVRDLWLHLQTPIDALSLNPATNCLLLMLYIKHDIEVQYTMLEIREFRKCHNSELYSFILGKISKVSV